MRPLSSFIRASKSSGASGFTLIEIVVALAVIGLIMGVAVGQMDRIFELEMKKTSNRLASTIRYLYNKAAMDRMYIRLVLDIEEQSYWVEATTDPFVLAREDSSRPRPQEARKKEGEGGEASEGEIPVVESAEGGGGAAAEGEVQKMKVPEPKFGPIDSHLLKPVKMPDMVFIKDLYVEHARGPIEGGKGAIHFFPNGYVERAVINLRDEEDTVNYSLETNPISGRVSIEPEYRSMNQERR